MNDKRTRIITRIFTLDGRDYSTGLTSWKETYDLEKYLEEENKHYGLHLISDSNEIYIYIEYTNIIWEYKFFYGSYKMKFKELIKDDERWNKIEKDISEDLMTMGLEHLKEDITSNLKQKKYFEYRNKVEQQFKSYCV